MRGLGVFLFSGFFWGNPCEDIHPVKTCGIDCRKTTFEQELAFYRPVFLQSSCSDSAECKFEKVWGSKICATVQLAWSTSSYMGSGLSLEHQYSSLIRSQFLFKRNLLTVNSARLDWMYVLARVLTEESSVYRETTQNNLLFPVTVLPTAT